MASLSPRWGWISKSSLSVAALLLGAFALFLPAITVVQAASGDAFSLLYSFKGSTGAYPLAGLTYSSGNLYGTTSEGGAHGGGVVFKLNSAGDETVLHSFKGGPSDGSFPLANVILDSGGNLYGTTTQGGKYGFGTVFRLEENGDETLLHSFGGSADDGRYPAAGLIFDAEGNLYGTTQEGGTSGFGTVFEIEASGKEMVLHSFAGNPGDGRYPIAGLVRDAKGNLFGTTELGGTLNDGVVFKLKPNGSESLLYSFTGRQDGAYPFGGVVLDSKGNLYGTTAYGANGIGVVFKVTPAGGETALYAFEGGADGEFPSAGLVRDSNGNLYGTAEFSGNGAGDVFSISPAGVETTLHTFEGADGADMLTPVILDGAGNLYGTATDGGASGKGTVFRITLP